MFDPQRRALLPNIGDAIRKLQCVLFDPERVA